MRNRPRSGVKIVLGCALAIWAAGSLAAEVPNIAQTACMTAVNSNYGGNVRNLDIVHMEYSEANSVVIMNADGERWRCLVSNHGKVEELSVEGDSPKQDEPPATSAAESACMSAVNRNYAGKVKDLRIIGSKRVHGHSIVNVYADGEHFRCQASNDGEIQDLRVK